MPGHHKGASASVGAPSQNVARNPTRFTTFLVQGKFREGHAGTSRENCHVQDRRHSSGEDALTTRGVGSRRIVTLFSLVTSLTQVSGPMVQAAKPETAHYASMTNLLNLFRAL